MRASAFDQLRVGKYIPQKQPELVPSPLLCKDGADAEDAEDAEEGQDSLCSGHGGHGLASMWCDSDPENCRPFMEFHGRHMWYLVSCGDASSD